MFTSKEGGDKNFDTTIKIKNVLYVKKWNYSLRFKIFYFNVTFYGFYNMPICTTDFSISSSSSSIIIESKLWPQNVHMLRAVR